MTPLDTFHPTIDTPESVDPSLGCSAHYFELSASTLGVAWCGQGLRCSTCPTPATCARSATTA